MVNGAILHVFRVGAKSVRKMRAGRKDADARLTEGAKTP